ncbi:DnaD domain-containing protein [Microbacteriaceae bacterium 4G12]
MVICQFMLKGYWQDPFVMELTPKEKYFYAYLLMCPKARHSGIFALSKRIVAIETGYGEKEVDELLARFIEYGKILYDANTNEVYIKEWITYNPITNTNLEKCILRELKEVKNKSFVQMFIQACVEDDVSIPLILTHFKKRIEEERPLAKLYDFYQQNFGALSPYIAEELNAWVGELSEELVLKALQISHEQNKRTFAYVKGILRDWHGKGYTKIGEVEKAQEKFRKKTGAIIDDTEKLLAEEKEWKQHALSDEEIKQLLGEKGWRP